MGQRIVLAMVLACVLSACEKKPGGQTVAVVNNEEITAADLNAELSNANVPASGASKEVRAQLLDRLIDRRLLAQQAKADGLDKSPEYLNQERRSNETLLINMLIARQANTQQVPSADDIAKYEASHPGTFAKHEVWTLDTVNYPLPKDPAVIAKINAANSLDEIVQALTSAGIQFTRTSKDLDSAMVPANVYNQIANLGTGRPFVVPGPDRAVASVITARKPAPFTADQARQIALSQLKRQKVSDLLMQRIKDLKAKAKIEYQPGFGPAKQ
jgi:EpsD family peptidyl-prolyl cis-trans isomerase